MTAVKLDTSVETVVHCSVLGPKVVQLEVGLGLVTVNAYADAAKRRGAKKKRIVKAIEN